MRRFDGSLDHDDDEGCGDDETDENVGMMRLRIRNLDVDDEADFVAVLIYPGGSGDFAILVEKVDTFLRFVDSMKGLQIPWVQILVKDLGILDSQLSSSLRAMIEPEADRIIRAVSCLRDLEKNITPMREGVERNGDAMVGVMSQFCALLAVNEAEWAFMGKQPKEVMDVAQGLIQRSLQMVQTEI